MAFDLETAPTVPSRLTSEGIVELGQRLDAVGYVVVPGVVPKEPLADLARQLETAYEHSHRFSGGGTITGHLNCFPGRSAAFVWDALRDSGVVDAVLTLRAGRDNSVRPTLNYNLPGSVAQHYHMDGLFTEDFLICNIAVVDTDMVNGAIDVLPGTNREYLPFWKYATRRSYRSSTRLAMARGDLLIRKSTLWHRGMPNYSTRPRPMMSVTFGEVSAPEVEDARASFDGDIAFYPNWFGTSRVSALRERTFRVAPWSYSAFRLAKSLRGRPGYSSY